jgi:hypothetical protein
MVQTAFRWAATALLLTTAALVPIQAAAAAAPVADECGGPLKDVTYRGYLAFGEHTSQTTRVPDTWTRYGFYGTEGMRLRLLIDTDTFQGQVAVSIYWINAGHVPEPICVTGPGEVQVPPLEVQGHYLFIVRPAAGETGTFAFTMVLDRD